MPKAHALRASVPTAPLHVNASLPVLIRLEQMVRFDKKVRDPANVEELHEMRIAMRWLRYTLEVFACAIEGAEADLQALKHLQHMLGQIHDTDILLPLLEEDLGGEECRPGVRSLYEDLRDERARLHGAFIEAWDATVASGFPVRLWNAALTASAPPDTPPHNSLAKDRLLPSKRARRVDITVALLRLAPYAAATATPDTADRLLDALDGMEHAAEDPCSEDAEWLQAAAALCARIQGSAE